MTHDSSYLRIGLLPKQLHIEEIRKQYQFSSTAYQAYLGQVGFNHSFRAPGRCSFKSSQFHNRVSWDEQVVSFLQ